MGIHGHTSGRRARDVGAEAFIDGDVFAASNIITDGETIWSYGKHFPMARMFPDRQTVVVNTDRYSATTSQHQSALRRALTLAGYVPNSVHWDLEGWNGETWSRSR